MFWFKRARRLEYNFFILLIPSTYIFISHSETGEVPLRPNPDGEWGDESRRQNDLGVFEVKRERRLEYGFYSIDTLYISYHSETGGAVNSSNP